MNPKSNWPLTSQKHHVPSANVCTIIETEKDTNLQCYCKFTGYISSKYSSFPALFRISSLFWIAYLLLFMFYQRYESEFIMRFIIYHKIKQDLHVIGLYMTDLSVNELTRSFRAVTESSF